MYWKRSISFLVAIAVFVALPVAAATSDDPSSFLSDDERAELLRLLDESRDLFLGLIEDVSEEQWTFKQNPDRWSVGQCAEHLVRSEIGLFAWAEAALANEPDAQWQERTKGKDDLLRQVMPNRRPMGQGGATAPIEVRPRDNWSREQVLEQFDAIRTRVRTFVQTTDRPLKAHTYEHPFPVFNWLNAHQWTLYVPLHTIRHSRQIIEVQEAADYPQK